jgi:hypothetical protein
MTQQESRHATNRPERARIRAGTSADRARFWASLNRREEELEAPAAAEHADQHEATGVGRHRDGNQSEPRIADTDPSAG